MCKLHIEEAIRIVMQKQNIMKIKHQTDTRHLHNSGGNGIIVKEGGEMRTEGGMMMTEGGVMMKMV